MGEQPRTRGEGRTKGQETSTGAPPGSQTRLEEGRLGIDFEGQPTSGDEPPGSQTRLEAVRLGSGLEGQATSNLVALPTSHFLALRALTSRNKVLEDASVARTLLSS